ncbi:MAG: TraR/DksA family transcriptional regulator [Acidimicrobiia bacterium]|nr:TraR/DksA family transcriptional regulator [Acidimicrobiia bacterium]
MAVADVRARLAAERARTEREVSALRHSFDEIVEGSALVSTDDEHDPEGATIAFERQQVAALLAEARQHLVAIARAEERLEAGLYGVCEQCGQPVGDERLEARPAALACVRCAATGLLR